MKCCMCGRHQHDVALMVRGKYGAVCSECSLESYRTLKSDESLIQRETGEKALMLANEVSRANQMLSKLGLVVMHSGNVSGYDPESKRVFIKPSGMDYAEMTGANMVPVELDSGKIVGSTHKPSVDLPHHLYLYRNMPDVRAIVHTHSNYATAFAACHKPIPLALTAIADEFGGEIPCAPYIDNQDDRIGEAILEHKGRGPAILLGNHGVFTWGPSVAAALKAAAMVEDVAKTLAIAGTLGDIVPIDADEAEKWYDRYQNRYGQ